MNEQVYPLRSHRYWAYIVIGVIIILFGAFWYYERFSTPQPTVVAPVAHSSEPTLADLQAAAINTEIPDFSSEF